MAPERPRALVILDLSDPGADEGGTVYKWDPAAAVHELVVLWEAARCPTGFDETVDNVLFVAAPPEVKSYYYALERQALADPLLQSWRGQLRNGALMLVAVLPPGYAFAEPSEGTDWPVGAKTANGRMAVYWYFFGGDATVEPTWRITPAQGPDAIAAACKEINGRTAPPMPPEPALPSAEERHEWAAQRSAPIAGAPPSVEPQ